VSTGIELGLGKLPGYITGRTNATDYELMGRLIAWTMFMLLLVIIVTVFYLGL